MTGAGRFADLIQVRHIGDERFEAVGPLADGATRIYGGFIMATSLGAASKTTPEGFVPQSLHCYFARGASGEEPLLLAVERFREGRMFCTRRVAVTQNSKPIAALQCSFYTPQAGFEWSRPASGEAEWSPPPTGKLDSPIPRAYGFDVRRTENRQTAGLHPMWVRAVGDLGSDWTAHAGAIAAMSDFAAGAACAPPGADVPIQSVSLEHAVHFHRPRRADEWLLLNAGPYAAASGRGYMHGGLWDTTGVRIASISQEAYWIDGPPIWATG